MWWSHLLYIELEDMGYGFRKYHRLYLLHRKGRYIKLQKEEDLCLNFVQEFGLRRDTYFYNGGRIETTRDVVDRFINWLKYPAQKESIMDYKKIC
jgi:hypothetical protein